MPPIPRSHEFFIAAGTATGRRSSTWHVWNTPGKDDVYIAEETMLGVFKVSLHQSGQLHVGFSKGFVAACSPGAAAGLKRRRRLKAKWSAAPVHPSVQILFRLGLPPAELRTLPPSPNQCPTFFLPPAPLRRSGLGFFVIAPGRIPRGGANTSVLWTHLLPSGRSFSVWSTVQPFGQTLRVAVKASRAISSRLPGGPARRILVAGVAPDGVHFFVDAAP
jgi:hypothetical protein